MLGLRKYSRGEARQGAGRHKSSASGPCGAIIPHARLTPLSLDCNHHVAFAIATHMPRAGAM